MRGVQTSPTLCLLFSLFYHLLLINNDRGARDLAGLQGRHAPALPGLWGQGFRGMLPVGGILHKVVMHNTLGVGGILSQLRGRGYNILFLYPGTQFLSKTVIFDHKHVGVLINYWTFFAQVRGVQIQRVICRLMPEEASIQFLSPEGSLNVIQRRVEPHTAHSLLH